jgi:hypothetical protein
MTSSHFHAVIWMDHHRAQVFHFNSTEEDHEKVHTHNSSAHLHHQATSAGGSHEKMDPSFINEILGAVLAAGEILVVGPGNAKTEFITYVEKHHPKVRAKILGVETVDHPSDREIVAYARKFFKPVDAMLPR